MLYFLPIVRKDRGLSLEQLAEAAHTHRFICARLERGERPRDMGIVQKLATALSVDPQVFTADAITIRRDGPDRGGAVSCPTCDQRPSVLFDAELCKELRISLTTLKRLRRHGALPIPELPSLDKRHRYARQDVDAFLAREGRGRVAAFRRRSA